jgi:dihydroxy-acid dehydratase
VHDLGKIVKGAVEKQGMLAWQFNTVGVSDAITMGGEGTHILLYEDFHTIGTNI